MGFRRRYKNFIENFLSGEQGRQFFQVFYNLGAAIVIIGALAKLTHWPWGLGNILLTVGLLTEFLVFLISAFDHPAKEYQWERVFSVLDTNDVEDRPSFEGVAASGSGGETVIINGGGFGSGNIPQEGFPVQESAVSAVERMSAGQVRQSFGIPNSVAISEEDTNALTESIKKMAAAADQLSKMSEMTEATRQYLDRLSEMSENMEKFSSVTGSLTDVSDVLLNSYKNITDNSNGINESSRNYVLQMQTLNHNIAGLSNIYEIQLHSVSSQIEVVNRINAGLSRIKEMYEGSVIDSTVFRSETEKMTRHIAALNTVYSRLLNAMTMNMNMQQVYQNPNPGYAQPYNPNPNPNV
ncbi:MAG: gliding motility protein GldL [Dysgonamonadaceae bacterium]|jgi:gliding motility-associated protein GldL|nr:gliding motility protein GldL [Dysgonamonadaceae bacterium]